MSYNGWTNWETWNVHMWIGNDEMFNRLMAQGAKNDWDQFKALAMKFGITKTKFQIIDFSMKLTIGDIPAWHQLELLKWVKHLKLMLDIQIILRVLMYLYMRLC